MPKKPKFKPEITRVKLNPEQAVLACSCPSTGYIPGGSVPKQDTCEVIGYSKDIQSKANQGGSSGVAS